MVLFLANVVAGALASRPRPPRGTDMDPEQGGSLEAERSAVIAQKRASPVQHERAQERGRGREADTPSAIPARGWKDIAWRIYSEITDDRIVAVAAGVTFYALLAIFPAIGAIVALYGLFADAATINDHLAGMAGLLPDGALDVVSDQIKRITAEDNTKLGLAFFVGLAVSLWSANAGMKAIFDALNIVYDEVEKRSFIKLNALSLIFTLGAILFLLVAMGAMVVLPIVLDYIWLGQQLEALLKILRWPALLIAVMLGLCAALSLRAEPLVGTLALGDVGQCAGGARLDRRIDAVLLVRGQLRQLQQDLWLARCGHRLHDVDMDFDYCDSRRRRTELRDGAPDGA